MHYHQMNDPLYQVDNAELILTLTPLATQGEAALAPDLSLGILTIVLRKVSSAWHNAFNEITTRKADDLFACAARSGGYYDLIPKGADLTAATLDIIFEHSPEPHFVEIIPPNTLKVQKPADVPLLLAFLARRGFRIAQKAALALMLSSTAVAPGGWLADDIDDDSDSRPTPRHLNV
jgi:hypothetical protein